MILNEEGVRGLFTGLGPRLTKVGPACAIMISTYEIAKEVFRTTQ
jgi:solute carrier family 25, member 39/40